MLEPELEKIALDAMSWSQSLKFEFWLHNPGCNLNFYFPM